MLQVQELPRPVPGPRQPIARRVRGYPMERPRWLRPPLWVRRPLKPQRRRRAQRLILMEA